MEEFTTKITVVSMNYGGGEDHLVGVSSIELGTTGSVRLKDGGMSVLQEILKARSPNDLIGKTFKTFQRNPAAALLAQIVNGLDQSLIAEPQYSDLT